MVKIIEHVPFGILHENCLRSCILHSMVSLFAALWQVIWWYADCMEGVVRMLIVKVSRVFLRGACLIRDHIRSRHWQGINLELPR